MSFPRDARIVARELQRYYRDSRAARKPVIDQPDFECAAAPQSNILCFRQKGDDERQMALRARILAEGGFYLSTAVHGGRRWLRLVFMNPDTGLAEVRRLLERLRAAG
jgi:L-2,4-diaminobutyrate decarboxylase